jgi:hypothetical protein
VQFRAPENNLAAIPPGFGTCPACKKPGSLIRYDPIAIGDYNSPFYDPGASEERVAGFDDITGEPIYHDDLEDDD